MRHFVPTPTVLATAMAFSACGRSVPSKDKVGAFFSGVVDRVATAENGNKSPDLMDLLRAVCPQGVKVVNRSEGGDQDKTVIEATLADCSSHGVRAEGSLTQVRTSTGVDIEGDISFEVTDAQANGFDNCRGAVEKGEKATCHIAVHRKNGQTKADVELCGLTPDDFSSALTNGCKAR